MKVTFVYPGNFRERDYRWRSGGLCSLSACVKQHGHEVSLIDLRNLTSWEEYTRQLKTMNPGILAITAMTNNFFIARQAAEIAKKVSPDIVTVLGGIHATLMTEEAAACFAIDYLITGEGEISFPELLEHLKTGKHPDRIITGKRPDLDRLPFPDVDLFPDQERPLMTNLPTPFVTVLSSRGCRAHCTFCQPSERIMFGKHVRRRSVRHVIAELESLQKKINFKSFMLADDCLTEDPAWVREFCARLKAHGFTQPWVCQVRADHVSRQQSLLQEMKASGLSAVHIGFESGSQRMLNFMRKGTTVKQNRTAYKILKKLGIEMFGMFIIGFPTETKSDVRKTIRLIRSMRLHRRGLAFFTPYPGSELYDYCKQRNLLAITDPGDYDRAKLTPKIKGVDYAFLVTSYQLCSLPDPLIQFSKKIRQRIGIIIKTISTAMLGKTVTHSLVGQYNKLKTKMMLYKS